MTSPPSGMLLSRGDSVIYEKNVSHDSIQMQIYFHSTVYYKTPITFFFNFSLPLGVSGKQVINSTLVSHILTSMVLCHHSRKAWLHQLSGKKKGTHLVLD